MVYTTVYNESDFIHKDETNAQALVWQIAWPQISWRKP